MLAQHPIRELIHDVERRGLAALLQCIDETARRSLPMRGDTPRLLAELRAILDDECRRAAADVSVARLRALLRYVTEQRHYRADATRLLGLLEHTFFRRGTGLIDLGAGAGEAVEAWALRGGPAIGIDVSPGFVAANRLLRLGFIDSDGPRLAALTRRMAERRVVLTSLTLDRTAIPGQLLRNLIELAGRRGHFVVGSIFPIIPEDDEPGGHPLTYTPARHRIGGTGTEQGDLRLVRELIADGRTTSLQGYHAERDPRVLQLPRAVDPGVSEEPNDEVPDDEKPDDNHIPL